MGESGNVYEFLVYIPGGLEIHIDAWDCVNAAGILEFRADNFEMVAAFAPGNWEWFRRGAGNQNDCTGTTDTN